MRYTFACALALLAAVAAHAQKFEVATIKPNANNDHRVMMRMAPGGRVNMTGVTVRQLISQAFNVRDFQISGGPSWMGSDAWDIQAKAEDGAGDRVPRETMQAMLRTLLVDRFALKVREESQEASGYVLLTGKSGPKLKVSESAGGPQGMIRMGRGMINTQGATMAMLVQQLSQQLGKPVVDKTGIDGRYDIELRWTPEPGQGLGGLGGPPPPPDALPPADPNGLTIFTAVQEQLGLRLDSQKTTVPVIIVEALSRPSEN
ncbi:MAG: TIGR03435 family protein [Bryobacterales bacterium]|nr:TIGR03435 family protein [Bryobacterales bacterium]